MTTATFDEMLPRPRGSADRLGLFASVLCAIHCLVTPLLLVLLPAFGRAWAHPASHWGMALIVVPLALLTLVRGFRIHRRRWVLVTGSVGIALIVVGAALPAFTANHAPVAAATDACEDGDNCKDGDTCCPSIEGAGTENARLVIPPASIVTALGGLALVATHLGNLCRCCSACRLPGPASRR